MKVALFASAACIVVTSAAHAQTQSADPALDEIIVTAERRSGDLQDTPVAVTAITSEDLQARGVQSVRGLEGLVPSLSIGSQTNGPGANSATFWIRGLGQIRAGNGSEPSVPLYIDDFYYPGISGNVLRAMDIEQVEVLRGPQGTLFGRNSIGGAIRYRTRKPTEDFEGFLEGTYGSYDRIDLIGALNVPIGDKLAVRLTGATMQTDGYVDEVIGDRKGGATENRLARAQVRFRPTDAITIDLSYELSESESRGSSTYISQISPTGTLAARWNSRPTNLPRYTQDLASPCTYCTYGGLQIDNFNDTKANHLRFVADWQVSDSLELKWLSGRSQIDDTYSNDLDGSPAHVARQGSTNSIESWSHELQAIGDLGTKFHYVGGLFYYKEELETLGSQFSPNAAGIVNEARASSLTRRESLSAYANLTLDVTERLSVTGGLRVGQEEISIRTLSILPVAGMSNSGSSDEDMVLPLLRVQYDWSKDVMTYATVSRGFRAGGFNIVPANADTIPFQSEEVTSFEVGARTEFWNGRARVNPTFFYTDYKNMQINRQYTPPPPAPQAPTSILENAGEAHIYGLELESDFAVTDAFRLRVSGAFLEGAFDRLNPGVGVNLGSPLPRLPRWSYTLGGQYRVELASGVRLTANLDYSWRSEQASAASNVDALVVPSYGLLNGQVELRSADKRWSIAVFGTNLADKEYVTGGLNLLTLVGNLRWDMGRPRELGVRLRFNY
ncbi:hypothetical protein C1T17_11035 [Sphingobium sp. SCG-1]|uniref:TonB-dependent receptor n=1 Tax=Sphingobium sp. SCG-1 TaxID=2072936 RepID=UPI000CD6B9C7|nr:TonB-dependent receptor [Sphingobium sp. SCG-1]AUW58554.1 hypothetical protein C1T17_11035 [Sphingobium sp. SCG-1]